MKKLLPIVFLALFSFTSALGCGVRTVPEGTTLEDVDVSGLYYKEFLEKKESIADSWNSRQIELRLEEKQETVEARELGLNFFFDDDRIMREAGEYRLEVELCEETALETVEALFPMVLEEPVDAELIVEDEPKIIEHHEGRQVLLEEVAPLIAERAREDDIELPVGPKMPEVTTEDIKNKGIREVVAYFTTEFDRGQRDRAHNLALASEGVDHTMLAPGEVFSFNNTAGPYSSARGFLSAPVFREGEVTTGVGGGVCQVSSTLYNAALLAGVEIVERHAHSLPVWYIPLARDAAVSFGGGDLQFRNSLEHHIYIRMGVDRETGVIEAKIFGTKGKKIEVYSEIEERIPPPVKEEKVEGLKEKEVVEEGRYGYKARSWKIVDGEWEFLSRDTYQPRQRVVKVPLEEEKPEKEEAEEDKPALEDPEEENGQPPAEEQEDEE